MGDGSESGSFVAAPRRPRDADPIDSFRHRPVVAGEGWRWRQRELVGVGMGMTMERLRTGSKRVEEVERGEEERWLMREVTRTAVSITQWAAGY